MNNMLTRASSGAVYVAAIVGAILGGETWFMMLCALFAVLSVTEFERLVVKPPRNTAALLAILVDVLVAACVVWMPYFLSVSVLYIVLFPAFVLLRGILALYDSREKAFLCAACSVMAIIYTAMPMAILAYIYQGAGNVGKWLVLIAFIMVWLNDTGAYCVGSACGKHKMSPRLSPKKSWEGFFGGLICCVGAGIACNYLVDARGWDLALWIGLGVVVSVAATWGDLFESLLKRNLGVKDSGNLIPGHGGILDRIDSMLFVAPALLLYIEACIGF